jgi:HNH endonuclease
VLGRQQDRQSGHHVQRRPQRHTPILRGPAGPVGWTRTGQGRRHAGGPPARSAGPTARPGCRRRLDDDTKAWLRRLWTDPVTGRLAAVDPHRRLFGRLLRLAVIVRDQLYRTPYCGAPIRHIDHPMPVADGGQTTETNGQGLCEACNYTKQAPGWQVVPDPDGGAAVAVTITTPTGHTYLSRPPALPGHLELAADVVEEVA